MREAREFSRLAVSLGARYLSRGSQRDRPATVANLSANGLAFFAGEALAPGTRLERIEFEIGDQPPRRLRPGAKVVRCQPNPRGGAGHEFLIGAQFFGIDPVDRAFVDRYVRESQSPSDGLESTRIVLEQPVSVRFEHFDEFVTTVSQNLSRSGMFIASDDPQPAGTRFEFILQLGADFTLVQGLAEVAWGRLEDEGPDMPRGMGIRFVELDPASQNVLQRLIGSHTEVTAPRQAFQPRDAAPESSDATVIERRLR